MAEIALCVTVAADPTMAVSSALAQLPGGGGHVPGGADGTVGASRTAGEPAIGAVETAGPIGAGAAGASGENGAGGKEDGATGEPTGWIGTAGSTGTAVPGPIAVAVCVAVPVAVCVPV